MDEPRREQLDFFGAEPKHGVDPAVQPQHVLDLGHALPANIHLGTSSWSFAGWEGIVYAREAKTQQLSRRGLGAYGQHPLFRSVGVDRSFYAPVRSEELAQYAAQVPDTFRFLVKAHGECTLARFGRNASSRPGQLNPRFLDSGYARDAVVQPFVEGLGGKAGVLLFQFSPQALAPLGGSRGLPERLHKFFDALPKLEHGHYAVELRNSELFTRRYVRALADLGVQHCLNAMPNMQTLRVQYAASGGPQRDALVVRWMLHPRQDYQGAKQRYAPFNRLVDADPETRGSIVGMLRDSRDTKIPTYVIVNNKAEGSSPLSILAMVEELVGDDST